MNQLTHLAARNRPAYTLFLHGRGLTPAVVPARAPLLTELALYLVESTVVNDTSQVRGAAREAVTAAVYLPNAPGVGWFSGAVAKVERAMLHGAR